MKQNWPAQPGSKTESRMSLKMGRSRNSNVNRAEIIQNEEETRKVLFLERVRKSLLSKFRFPDLLSFLPAPGQWVFVIGLWLITKSTAGLHYKHIFRPVTQTYTSTYCPKALDETSKCLWNLGNWEVSKTSPLPINTGYLVMTNKGE